MCEFQVLNGKLEDEVYALGLKLKRIDYPELFDVRSDHPPKVYDDTDPVPTQTSCHPAHAQKPKTQVTGEY